MQSPVCQSAQAIPEFASISQSTALPNVPSSPKASVFTGAPTCSKTPGVHNTPVVPQAPTVACTQAIWAPFRGHEAVLSEAWTHGNRTC
mmetsp:Transcript_23484/g.40537  ORF Transcript_23484/g.40537 Transcript_23484/m.40537 type:complete len:89 (+) Transcript_23484:1262-1528(+)